MKRDVRFIAFVVAFLLLIFSTAYPGQSDWKGEFESICSKVQIADRLSDEELKTLINRAETLINELRDRDLPSKKVYIFRLKKCKSFFEYILQLREQKD